MTCNSLEKIACLSCSRGRWHWPWSVSLCRCGVIRSIGLLQIPAAKKRDVLPEVWNTFTKRLSSTSNLEKCGLVSFLRIFGQHRKHSVILIFKDWGKWLSTCGGKLQGELSPSFYLLPWLDRKLQLRRVREATADANKGPLPLNPSLGYIFARWCFASPDQGLNPNHW